MLGTRSMGIRQIRCGGGMPVWGRATIGARPYGGRAVLGTHPGATQFWGCATMRHVCIGTRRYGERHYRDIPTWGNATLGMCYDRTRYNGTRHEPTSTGSWLYPHISVSPDWRVLTVGYPRKGIPAVIGPRWMAKYSSPDSTSVISL